MKAVICTKYGPPEVLQLAEVDKPTPKDNEVLIKIYATTVHIGDTRIRSFTVPFLFKLPFRLGVGFSGPRNKVLGMELAGVIEEAGKDVAKFKVGDAVFASTDTAMGAYAEYTCMSEDKFVALKPANMTYEEAATAPNGANTAHLMLKKAKISKGQKILINGASGSVGTSAVQLAKYYGAEVTGVCSTSNLELVKSLGSDHVIDYTQEDFTQNTDAYDVVFDAVGKSSFSKSKRALKDGGIYLTTVPALGSILQKLKTSIFGSKKVALPAIGQKPEDLVFLKGLIEAGHLKAVIDKVYPLEQIVEAHAYVDTGRKKGNVAITVADDKEVL
ncbi:NAD(P)-dependent alcohol dehydrogenase [Chloroflexota bacterium]